MKHQKKGRKFGRKKDQRKAFLQSLTEALIRNEKIITTEARAKEIRPFVEKLITKAKTGSLPARRLVISKLGTAQRAKKLFDEIAPRYKDRKGGYTRIVKMAPRSGDGAKRAKIEFV